MTFSEIREMPTDTQEFLDIIKEFEVDLSTVSKKYDESCFRSFHIVFKIKELLRKKTNPEVILEIIEDLQGD